MPTPVKPELDYSYTAFQQSQGDNSFPGTALDNDLDNLKTAIDATIDFIAPIIRSDGGLSNGIVDVASLGPDVRIGVAPPRVWVTGTSYVVNDTVSINNSIYICAVAHTSATFATDLVVGYWSLIAEFTVPATLVDASITEPKYGTGSVSTRALADNSVTTAKIPSAAVTSAKLAAAVAASLIPVGCEMDYPGVIAPSGWLFEFGQNVSRTTYSALLSALAPAFTGDVTSGSTTVSNVSIDLRNLGLEGSAIEGAGISAGATIVSISATTITLSSNATSNTTGVQIRAFPWGNGDGASTFTLPDARDRVTIGRGNMGGTSANRITASGAGNPGLTTARLGAAGGVDRHTLTAAQVPAHTHTVPSQVFVPRDGWSTAGGNLGTVASGRLVTGSGTIESGETLESLRAAGTDQTLSLSGSQASGSVGSGEAHPNLPPSRVINRIIFTGVA